MIAAGHAVGRRWLGAAEIVIHVNQDVAALRQFDDGIVGTAVAGVANRSLAGVDTEGETLEIGLDVLRMADGDLPSVAADHRTGMDLSDLRRRTPARQLAASRLELILAALVFDPRANVRAIDAVDAEQLFGHAGDRRRAVDIEIGDAIRALIPALQDQAPVVHAMVVVEMREERVRDVDRTMAALQQPVMRAGSVVPDDHVVADLDQIAGALTVQRRRWRAGAEQRDAERLRRRRRRRPPERPRRSRVRPPASRPASR